MQVEYPSPAKWLEHVTVKDVQRALHTSNSPQQAKCMHTGTQACINMSSSCLHNQLSRIFATMCPGRACSKQCLLCKQGPSALSTKHVCDAHPRPCGHRSYPWQPCQFARGKAAVRVTARTRVRVLLPMLCCSQPPVGHLHQGNAMRRQTAALTA